MIDFAVDLIKSKYQVAERDLGDKKILKHKGMKFEIHSYEIKGIGNCSTIQMKAMLGLMKMESFILTPQNKDAPLFNSDMVLAMGKETLLLEMYNTQLSLFDDEPLNQIKQKYSDLPDHSTGEHWYDSLGYKAAVSKSGKKMEKEFAELYKDYITAFVNNLDKCPECDAAEKKQKVDVYVQGLINNGGPATDVFVKMLGKEAASEILEKYLFASR